MNKTFRIVITGPESTAKSTLSKQLADYYNGIYYPEYARQYLNEKGSSYAYEDVVEIAKGQIQQYINSEQADAGFYFFDTWLIITKIWFDWVYKKIPAWLETEISKYPIDLYLLCKPDIPWEPDPLRENGGEDRNKLYEIYKSELVKRNLIFFEIEGIGEKRIQNAIEKIEYSLRNA